MCGIWGVIPSLSLGAHLQKKFLMTCLLAGAARGEDGAGVFQCQRTGKSPMRPSVFKKMGTGLELLSTMRPQLQESTLSNSWATVGHNRAATTGDISDEASHPFQHGNITLVHNGSVRGCGTLPGVTRSHQSRVDSDELCESMSIVGYKTALGHAYGAAYALVWHDMQDDKIRILRNHQRPMCIMRVKDGSILFASEGDMLWWAAGRSGIPRGEVKELRSGTVVEVGKDLSTQIYKLDLIYPEHNSYKGSKYTHYSWGRPLKVAKQYIRSGLGKIGLSGDDRLLFWPDQTETHHGNMERIHGYACKDSSSDKDVLEAVMFAHKGTIDMDTKGGIPVRAQGLYGGKNKSSLQTIVVAPYKPKKEFPLLIPGPKSSKVTPAEWLAATIDGCVQCQKPLSIQDAGDIIWVINETRPLCSRCVDEYSDWTSARAVRNN